MAAQSHSTCWSGTLPFFVLTRQRKLSFLSRIIFFLLIAHHNFVLLLFPRGWTCSQTNFPWGRRTGFSESVYVFWGRGLSFFNSFPTPCPITESKNLTFPPRTVRSLNNFGDFARESSIRQLLLPRPAALWIEFNICTPVSYCALFSEI